MPVELIRGERYPPHTVGGLPTHAYRVGFWWHQKPPPGSDIPPERMAWGVEWWDVTAEDVHEVIAWADAKHAADAESQEPFELYTLFVWAQDDRGDDILVKLAGLDPTHVEAGDDGFFRRHPL